MKVYCAIIAILLGCQQTQAANIFALMPTFSHSHYVLAIPLFKELSQSGHNLTVITLKGAGIKSQTYHEIVPELPEMYDKIFDGKINLWIDDILI